MSDLFVGLAAVAGTLCFGVFTWTVLTALHRWELPPVIVNIWRWIEALTERK